MQRVRLGNGEGAQDLGSIVLTYKERDLRNFVWAHLVRAIRARLPLVRELRPNVRDLLQCRRQVGAQVVQSAEGVANRWYYRCSRVSLAPDTLVCSSAHQRNASPARRSSA